MCTSETKFYLDYLALAEQTMAKLVLVIDDERQIVEICRDYLKAGGFEVITASDGPAGLDEARRSRPDLIVLDLMLPGMDGLAVCRSLRKETDIPIIMLTAKVGEIDKLIGLEMGADDYITKPFSPRELVARVRTVLRRVSGTPATEVIRTSYFTLDRTRYSALMPDREVSLTPTEFEILATLVSQPGRIFTRGQLLIAARGVAFDSYERAIDSHIRNIRRKVEPPVDERQHIITVHGVGYKFEE